jgi:multiple sugar transport system permease protein
MPGHSRVRRLRKGLSAFPAHAFLVGYALISLYPFLWMISAALKSSREVYANQSLIPRELRLDVIAGVWNQLDFWKYLLNSSLVALAVVIGIVFIYSLAGYGFAMTRFWAREALFVSFLALLLVPGVTILVPLVQLLRQLHLIGPDASQLSTYFGLVMPMINGGGPLAVFLFRGYFASLPRDLHDAAQIDGCREWDIYLRVYLPLAVPAIATIAILNFLSTWNAYIFPSVVLNNPDWFTLPLKLRDLDVQQVIQWNVRMAGSLIMVTPAILVFLFLQRYYIRGLSGGAVRG